MRCADIVVIGSGPACCAFCDALAVYTAKRNRTVLILEAGTWITGKALSYATTTQGALSDFEAKRRLREKAPDHPMGRGRLSGWLARDKPDYLKSSRMIACGGAGTVWSGWLCFPDPEDFAEGHRGGSGGWPLNYTALHPYLEDVMRWLGIPMPDWETLCLELGASTDRLADNLLDCGHRPAIVYQKPVDFARELRRITAGPMDIRIETNALALAVDPAESPTRKSLKENNSLRGGGM